MDGREVSVLAGRDVDRRPSRLPYYAVFTAYAFGAGIVLPVRTLFLQDVLHLSTLRSATYFIVLAGAGLLVNPWWGARIDRHGARAVTLVAIPGQIAGFVLLAFSHSYIVALAAAVIAGVGSSGYNAAQTPLLVGVFGRDTIGSMFGTQYLMSNVALGVGAFAGGTLVAVLDVPGYRAAIAAGALCPVLLLTWVSTAPWRSVPVSAEAIRGGTGRLSAASSPYRDRSFLAVMGLQALFVAFGFAQFASVLPVVVTSGVGLPVTVFSAMVVVNCVLVVLLQRYAMRWSKGRPPAAGLSRSMQYWAAAFTVGALAVIATGRTLSTLLFLVFAALFAAGEVFISPNMQPLVVEMAPQSRLGTYSAAISLVYGLGLAVGPGVGLVVIHATNSLVYWSVELIVAGLALLLIRAVRSRPVGSTDDGR